MDTGFLTRLLDREWPSKQAATYRAFPTLKSARWILPTSRRHRRSGIGIYRPTGALGRLGKGLIYFGLIRGEPAPAAAAPIDRLRSFISKNIGVSNIFVGLSLGTTGAYQRQTMRIMTSEGIPIAYAKFSDQALSKTKIFAEMENLTYLNGFPDIKRHIPEVLFFGEFDGFLILVTSAGPDRRASREFSREHENFLQTLFSITQIEKRLLDATSWHNIIGTVDWLSSRAPQQLWLDRFGKCMRFIHSEIGETPILLSMAHRDFVPWNTCREVDGSLFVFDWESAIQESPPLQDFFNFHALPLVMARRRYSVDGKVDKNIESGILGRQGLNRDALFAFYLVDVASYYLKAWLEKPGVGSTTVLTWAGREMDALMEKKHAL